MREENASRDLLADLLHSEVIPKLLESDAGSVTTQTDVTSVEDQIALLQSQVDMLVRKLRKGDDSAAQYLIESWLEQGLTGLQLYLNLLSNSARILGEMWCEDECSFGDVTLGVSSLHQLLHHYSGLLPSEVPTISRRARAFVVPMPGQTHIFGAAMLNVFFEAAGWECVSGYDYALDEIVSIGTGDHYDLICLSVSHVEEINTCKKLVGKLKRRARSQRLKILVGGKPFIDQPDLVEICGADGTAIDALQTLEIASEVCGLGGTSAEYIKHYENA